jgi:hypothetical protein
MPSLASRIETSHRRPVRGLSFAPLMTASVDVAPPDDLALLQRLPRGATAYVVSRDQPVACRDQAENAGGYDDKLAGDGQQLGYQPRRRCWSR